MNTFDFTPLFRTSVGFDRLASLLDSATRQESAGGYPPYNIEAVEDNHYRITMAVAGFTEAELNIVSEQNILKISGARKDAEDASGSNFLHRGIATRGFERRFQLADYVRVSAAKLENGLLHIDLEREIPEAMKPRTINIQNSNLLEGQKSDKAA